MALPTFTLRSAATTANAPFSLGHAFVQGDVPAGAEVVADIADFQCYGTTSWPDGSLKFATLSGRTFVHAGIPSTITLSLGTSAGGTALTIADLKATSITAAITAGAFGSATWSGTDWDTPFKTIVSGPKMSSWQFRKQIGTDAHAVAWLEVRLWSGGEVDVLPAVENGYLKVAAPGARSAAYTFTLGGTERFNAAIDLRHHSRTPLLSGAALTYWLGADPAVFPRLDVVYLQTTELVPTYSASRSATGLGLAASFTPLAAANLIYNGNDMTDFGYQTPIGLLPQHDVAYLICTDQPELLYGAVVRNGYAAGRYPIHYRDEATNLPPKFSDHPTLCLALGSGIAHNGGSSTGNLTPVTTGGVTANWDLAHSPAVGYMAHLLTGQQYHLDTMLFALTASWFNIVDTTSYYAAPANTLRFLPQYGAVQTRSLAWGYRHLAHALVSLPDDEEDLRPELVALAEGVNNHYHDTYVAQANNSFGIVQPGEDVYESGKQVVSIWQQDFITAAFGYALAMGMPVSSANRAKLYAFFQWKAKSVVMRLGAQGAYWYINAPMYSGRYTPGTLPNYQNGSGPWLATDTEVYTASLAVGTPPNSSWAGSAEGILNGQYTPDAWAKSMWGNLHPALAYAVRFSVPGAAAGYARMTDASNYIDIQSGFTTYPEWSAAPAAATDVSIPVDAFSGPCVRAYTTDYFPGKVIAGHRGLGVPAYSIPSGGTHGAGYAYNDLNLPADTNKAIMGRVIVRPVTGNLVTYEDTSFSFTPAGPGTESFQYQLYVDGVAVGTPRTVLLNSGTVAVAPGAPTVSLVAGNGTVLATVTPPASNGGATISSYTVTLSNGQTATGAGPTFTLTAANGVVVTATATATNIAGTSPASALSNPAFPQSGGSIGDDIAPVMVGEITIDLVSESVIAFSCQPATDAVGVTAYQYSIDGGVSWVDIGTARNAVVGGLPAGAAFPCLMRSRDQAGNVSDPIGKTISTLPGEVVAPASVNPFKTPTTGQYATRTYGWLVEMIGDWLHRSDLAARIPGFIMLAEAEINRKLGLVPRDIDVALIIPSNTRFIARPTDMGYPIGLWSDIHQPRIQLNAALASSLDVDSTATPGEPTTWAIDGWAIAFDRIADRDYPITFRYRQDNTLSEDNPTNEILVRSPDVYLYGSLAAAAPYMRDDDRTLMWESKFKRALAEVKIEASRTSATAPLRTEVPCSFLAR